MANLKCMYFQLDSTVSRGVMVILVVFHVGDPGSIPVEGNIFSSTILFFPFFIYFATRV